MVITLYSYDRQTFFHREKSLALAMEFILPLRSASCQNFSDAIRSHWGIENRVHWVMDVVFREDDCRVRQGFSAENLSVVRHIALNLLRSEKSDTFSIKKKRYLATLDPEYLKKILTQS